MPAGAGVDGPGTSAWDDLLDVPARPSRPVRRRAGAEAWRRWRMPALLLGLTSFSTLMVGASWWGGSQYGWLDLPALLASPSLLAEHLWRGVPFSGTLLGILLAHEFGHFFAARHHRVEASPPYLIPFPSLLGTLGAVIRMKGRIPNRRALVDIGASGPIAGFVVALPLLLWGLSLSAVAETMPPPDVPAQSLIGIWIEWQHRFQSPFHGVLLEGPSLVYVASKYLIFGAIPAGYEVHLHPVAMAAWFGLFVTALNLLPIGQLDGGHVTFAVLGPAARTIGRCAIVVLVGLGILGSYMWLLWALLGWKVIRTTHPPVVDPDDPLDRPRRWIGWASLVLLLLTFTPVPVQIY